MVADAALLLLVQNTARDARLDVHEITHIEYFSWRLRNKKSFIYLFIFFKKKVLMHTTYLFVCLVIIIWPNVQVHQVFARADKHLFGLAAFDVA